MIVRLAVKRVKENTVEEISRGGILDYMGGGRGTVEVHVYTSELEGLLLQDPETGDTWIHPQGSPVRIDVEGRVFCRWHNAPLDARDDPSERTYCTRPASGKLGYCNLHASSERALYDMCLGMGGPQSIKYCSLLERAIPDLSMSVYLTSLGNNRYKVGVTRGWRLIDRLAEQPHMVAVELDSGLGPTEARRRELSLSKKFGFTQLSRKENITPFLLQWKNSVPGLASIAEKVVGGSPPMHRVEPVDARPWMHARNRFSPGVYTPVGYWAGLLLLEDVDGVYYVVDSRRLLHRDVVYPLG